MIITYRSAIKEAIEESMLEDQDVFIMGEEIGSYEGAYKATKGLIDRFGKKRVIDSPISEYGFAGLCVGAAFKGLKPVVEFMSWNFALQAIDHILNSAAKTKYMSGGTLSVPIVFRGPNGYAPGAAGQHSQCFASYYARCPGLKVIAPYNANDAKKLLKDSIINDKGPIVFLEHEMLYGQEFEKYDSKLEIGQSKVVKKGKDITICTYSWTVAQALEVANEVMKERSIDIEVIDVVTIAPMDIGTIQKSVKKTSKIICVDGGWSNYGVGEHIVAKISLSCFEYLDSAPKLVGMENVPLPYAKNLELESIPSKEDIKKAIMSFF